MKAISVKNIIRQLVCCMLLLQMINISIDPPDLKQPKSSHSSHKADSPLNETESFYELISEGIFLKDVPESDENDLDKNSPAFDLYFFTLTCNELPVFNFPVEYHAFNLDNFPILYSEPSFPPPKQA